MTSEESTPKTFSPVEIGTKPVLRRATYVHVSDLINVYNIDHAMLEHELQRVKCLSFGSEDDNFKTEEIRERADASDESTDLEIETSPQKRLQPPKGGYNLCVLVGKANLVVDKKRVDQSRVRLAEVEVGDETGMVSLRARDEQIDILNEIAKERGAAVLRNCTLELYQGKYIRLAITKWAKLAQYPDHVASTPPPPSTMNSDRNYSAINLSVVASEIVEVNPENLHNVRQPKAPDSSDPGVRLSSRGGLQNPKPPITLRRGSKDKRASKNRQSTGRGNRNLQYGVMPANRPHISPLYGAGAHGYTPYAVYSQLDPQHQYHYAQPQLVVSPTSQQIVHGQYGLQHHQIHDSYQQHHQQASRHAPTLAATAMIHSGYQSVVPSASLDGSEYQSVPHPSTMSSPVLIPSAHPMINQPYATESQSVSGAQGPITLQDTHAAHYMSVSPDDSSQLTAKMNPDAMAFAPSHIGATEARSTEQANISLNSLNQPSSYSETTMNVPLNAEETVYQTHELKDYSAASEGNHNIEHSHEH